MFKISASPEYREEGPTKWSTKRGFTCLSCGPISPTPRRFRIASLVAEGHSPDAPEVMQYFRWTVMKLAEFNDMMPEEMRGDLSFECLWPQWRRGRLIDMADRRTRTGRVSRPDGRRVTASRPAAPHQSNRKQPFHSPAMWPGVTGRVLDRFGSRVQAAKGAP